MPPVGFELTISAGEWPRTYALDRAATGTGPSSTFTEQNVYVFLVSPCTTLDIKLSRHVCPTQKVCLNKRPVHTL